VSVSPGSSSEKKEQPITEIDPLAVGIATLAAFLASGAWYAVVPAPRPASAEGEASAAGRFGAVLQ
jgi:hypothetical protein